MRRPTQRSEVRALTSWCQDNNLQLNISKTKELIVDFRRRQREEHAPLHQRYYSGESQQQLQATEAQNGLKDPLQLLQVPHREDPDWLHITTWFGSCTALNLKALQ
ncbi:hypothetical protein L3Q82_020587, partial [Scortum barcoo]